MKTTSNKEEYDIYIYYDLTVEAYAEVKNYDIVAEAIEVNYNGALDERNVCKDDPCRSISIFKIKPEPEHCILDEKKNLLVYRIHVKNSDIATSVIDDWHYPHNFDDLAFGNSIRDKQQVKIREVRRLMQEI